MVVPAYPFTVVTDYCDVTFCPLWSIWRNSSLQVPGSCFLLSGAGYLLRSRIFQKSLIFARFNLAVSLLQRIRQSPDRCMGSSVSADHRRRLVGPCAHHFNRAVIDIIRVLQIGRTLPSSAVYLTVSMRKSTALLQLIDSTCAHSCSLRQRECRYLRAWAVQMNSASSTRLVSTIAMRSPSGDGTKSVISVVFGTTKVGIVLPW